MFVVMGQESYRDLRIYKLCANFEKKKTFKNEFYILVASTLAFIKTEILNRF